MQLPNGELLHAKPAQGASAPQATDTVSIGCGGLGFQTRLQVHSLCKGRLDTLGEFIASETQPIWLASQAGRR